MFKVYKHRIILEGLNNNHNNISIFIIKFVHLGQLAGACEYGDELSGLIKCGELD